MQTGSLQCRSMYKLRRKNFNFEDCARHLCETCTCRPLPRWIITYYYTACVRLYF